MKRAARSLRLVIVAAGAVLVACGATPPAAPPPMPDEGPPPVRLPASGAGFEQRLRERASSQGRQGRLAEAAISWEILAVLRPDTAEYRQRLVETRRLIDAALPDRLQRGALAQKRGDLDVAAAHYLAALALQPDHVQAAEALRQIERERNRRSFLGQYSRLTLTRRASADAQMAGPVAAVPLDRNVVEHAAMLGTQGEFDDAIALLERHLAADKRDTDACQLLADMYYQKAEKQFPRDKAAAIAALEKSVRLDPSNTRAAARLKVLRNGRPLSLSPIVAATGREGCPAR